MDTARDPLTTEVFYKKRNNQKFATADNRVAFHNRRANKLRQQMNSVNRPLFVNNKILLEIMNGKKKATFHKQFLLGKGFQFGVFTHYSDWEGTNRPSLYDFIILSLNDEKILIIKKTEND
jgi:hypothetical protein